MPSLSPADRLTLLGPLGTPCPECNAEYIRHYCRTCDEFFASCSPTCRQDETGDHANEHRVYLWTPGGILAIPDFDNFPFETKS